MREMWRSAEDIPLGSERNQVEEYLQREREEKQEAGCRRGKGVAAALALVGAIAAGSQLIGGGLANGMSLLLIPEFLLAAAGIFGICYFRKKESHIRQEIKKREEKSRSFQKQDSENDQKERARKQAVVETLQMQRIEKCALLRNIEEEMEETQKKSEKELELEQQVAASALAFNMLQKISENVYKDTREQLEEEISRILYSLTGGQYDRITLDEDMNLVVCQQGRTLYPWQLSRGTMEQMYLALRLGAGRFFTKEEVMPEIGRAHV